MKKLLFILSALSLLCVFSCTEKQQEKDVLNEEFELTFSASWAPDGATRTSLQEHGAVYWNPGDAINVFRGTSLSGRFESTLTESAPISEFQGKLTVTPGSTNISFDDPFWAVYPYSSATAFNGTTLTIDLPGVQTAQPWSFDGNLNPAIAVSDDMELSFYNVGGLFCFSVQGEGFYAASLRGNGGENLAGTLQVVVGDDNIPVVTDVQDGITSVLLNAPDGGTFEPNTLYYFVVVPQTFAEGLTLTLYKEGETGEVARNQEIVIRRSGTVGIASADVDPAYTVISAEYVFRPVGIEPTTLADGTVVYELTCAGTGAASVAVPFESYRNVDGEQIPVAVAVSGYAADNAGAPGTFGAEVPAGLGGFSVAYADNAWTGTASVLAREDGEVFAYDAVAVHTAALKANGDNGFGAGAPQDLSLYDIADLTTPRASGLRVTANCYVVDRAGWYMFPIVYGNAVDETRSGNVNGCNVKSYDDGTSKANPTDRYLWHTFQRADGELIGSPYILSDMGLTEADVEAVIVWEDVDASAPLVQASDVEVIDGRSFLDPAGAAVAVPYVKFRVDGDNIRQGNVLIAVRRTSDKVILWSWHIWITDADMTPVTLQSRSTVVPSNRIIRDNLGWCDTTDGEGYAYGDAACYVKVSQTEGSADPVILKFTRPATVRYPFTTGCGTFYQFGRKDPLLPGEGRINKAAFSPAGYTITVGESAIPVDTKPAGNVSSATQNPHVLYFAESTWIGPNSVRSDLWNLWNAAETYPAPADDVNAMGEDHVVVKTVYDPCPPGYSVPDYMAFSIFSHTMANYGYYDEADYWNDVNAQDRNGDGIVTMDDDYENGWYFYTSDDPATRETVFFGITYYREKEAGNIGGGLNGFYRTAKPKGTRYATTMAILTGPYGMAASRADGFAIRPAAEK